MKERWIVTSAWPYAHWVPHLGNLIGSLLSADIFTRYLRLRGHEVIMVSGSDEHGTPIEVEAIKQNKKPKELTDHIHKKILEIINGFNINFDNYTRTHNEIHINFTQEFYKKIYDNGYIYTKVDELLYCENDKIYLPDRFLIGVCPYCGYESARGDQCEKCGKLLTPSELINPKCSICGRTPVTRRTKHFYFNLPAFADKLYKFIYESKTLSENAKNFSLRMIKEGLKPRSITRNTKWGIKAPFPNAEDLTIYVWFEAVLGYISAVKEYFIRILNNPEKWREWWQNKDIKVAFFIGKDNIPFHTIIFPALLMATHEPYTLNFYIGATEYLNFMGMKFSKSKGIGIWCDEALKLLPADYWRYALTVIRPEKGDTNFTWKLFEDIINNDLNNNLGNLIHRTLTLINRGGGKILRPKAIYRDIEELIRKSVEEANKYYMETRFSRIPQICMQLSSKANALINEYRPWELINKNNNKFNEIMYNIYLLIKTIAILLYPIIPQTSLRILQYFKYNRDQPTWDDISSLPDIVEIDKEFKPLFKKIDHNKLISKLEEIRRGDKMIDIDTFSLIDLRVGKIDKAEIKAGTKKIMRLYVNIGDRRLKVLAGIAEHYKPKDLIGKKVIVVTNLKPKKIIDEMSEGMILAAEDEEGRLSLITVDREVSEGSRVR